MSLVSPYAETETYKRGRRVLLVPFACAFMVGPYGALSAGRDIAPVTWALMLLAVAVGAAAAGLAIALPRRTLRADGDARSVTILSTPPLPHVQQLREEHPFDAVAGTVIEEVGVQRTSSHGFRPVLVLEDGERVALKRQPSHEHAQDVVDHLVLLGLPGSSRRAQREAILDAPPPTTWL